ncbi:MAG: class II aldolase/adducin family protein [Betaproteobacteria bacterium]|nr:class II aldolase/adducin family protein [Betaproteobacteria bacterium]
MHLFRSLFHLAPITRAVSAGGGKAGAKPASGGPVDAALIEDLVAANRILADHGVLDGFGHVSVRHPKNPERYLISCSRAPELVCADDIMEFDLDSDPVDQRGRSMYLERFIHGEIYRARPDINAVVHSHSPSVIPFSVSSVPMRALYNMSGFLARGVPVFEIRDAAGMTDMLVREPALGRALATSLADKSVALMRGHGNVVVAPTLPLVVYRAIYTEMNAKLQVQAIGLGGSINYLDPEEGVKTELVTNSTVVRPWELWKKRAFAKK